MKVNLIHNNRIKTFQDVSCHVKLEYEQLGAANTIGQACVAKSSSKKIKGHWCKKYKKGENKGKESSYGPRKNKFKKNKKGNGFWKKKDKSKIICYNYGNMGYFARECFKPKKIALKYIFLCIVCILSDVLFTDSYLFWIVESRVIDYVAIDQTTFIEYRWV